MIKSFADRRTQELYVTGTTRRFPPDLAARAARKLEYIDLATRLEDLESAAWKPVARIEG